MTSTSTTVVSWAETCSDSTMRRAIVLRSRVIFSVVPRFGESAAGAPARAPTAAGAWRRGGGAAPGSGALAASAAASTSCLRMRPPMPVPVTEPRSTPCVGGELAHERGHVGGGVVVSDPAAGAAPDATGWAGSGCLGSGWAGGRGASAG